MRTGLVGFLLFPAALLLPFNGFSEALLLRNFLGRPLLHSVSRRNHLPLAVAKQSDSLSTPLAYRICRSCRPAVTDAEGSKSSMHTNMASLVLRPLLLSLGNFLHTLKLLFLEPLEYISKFLMGSRSYDFNNKCVWITGAGSGIGKALAIECYRLGATIVVTSRSEVKLREVEALCRSGRENDDENHANATSRQRIIVFPKDLSRYSQADDYYTELESKLKMEGIAGIDVLFNVAGTSSRGSALSSNMSTIESIMNINFMAPIALTKAVLPSMISRPQKQPRYVVVISSVQGKISIPFRSTYSASKHAVQGYFDSLRSELAASDSNVKVMIVSPGYVATDVK